MADEVVVVEKSKVIEANDVVRPRSASRVSVPKAEDVSAAKELIEIGDDDDEDEDEDDEEGGWETASLLEDLLDDKEPMRYATGEDICTAEEAREYRALLHRIGLEAFVTETLSRRRISARKLITAFNVRIPPFLGPDAPDEAFYKLLGLALVRELEKRQRLPHVTTIDHVGTLLRDARNVMIITGAGISTSLGIPDFRSKNTGFYSKLKAKGYDDPEEVFTLSTFDEDPGTFYELAHDILPDITRWTPTHQFIRLLQDKGKLLRNYTQNIDNVEAHAGIERKNLIQCHGSWATATCRKCAYKCDGEEIFPFVRDKKIAYCPVCTEKLANPDPLPPQKPSLKRKRSSNGNSNGRSRKNRDSSDEIDDGRFDIPQAGIMKPDITFFGEQLPDHFFKTLTEVDREKVDLVLVFGTSMKVAPVSEIPAYLPASVPQVYISRDNISHINFDVTLLGECDLVVRELAKRAGWSDEFTNGLLAMPPECPGRDTTSRLANEGRITVEPLTDRLHEGEWTIAMQ